MIFVTVGTTDFDDLVREMDRLAPELNERIVAQIGRGRYEPRRMEFFRFADSLEPQYSKAAVVVSHGGLGTLIEVIERGLKLIGVSNPDRYDRHQEDILGILSERKHMVWCRSLDRLKEAFDDLARVDLVPYRRPECRIAERIREFLHLPGDP
jgi:beta-1,4-N-acetylglucosaminyltransferase